MFPKTTAKLRKTAQLYKYIPVFTIILTILCVFCAISVPRNRNREYH